MNPNRYFTFRYYYSSEFGEKGFSSICVETLSFPSEEFLQSIAAAKVQKILALNEDAKINISIQGWNEFRNQKDYLLFINRKQP